MCHSVPGRLGLSRASCCSGRSKTLRRCARSHLGALNNCSVRSEPCSVRSEPCPVRPGVSSVRPGPCSVRPEPCSVRPGPVLCAQGPVLWAHSPANSRALKKTAQRSCSRKLSRHHCTLSFHCEHEYAQFHTSI